jgi:hypothetical protein
VAKVGTSKAGGTISQLGCSTTCGLPRTPIKEEEEEEAEEKMRTLLGFMAENDNTCNFIKF